MGEKKKTIISDLLFLAITLIFLWVSFISYQRIVKLNNDFGWINHTSLIKLKLEQLFSSVKDAETSQRGYLLTKDSSYISPLTEAINNSKLLLSDIEMLTIDNKSEHEKSLELRSVIDERFRILNEGVTMFSNKKAGIPTSLEKGNEQMDKVRMLTKFMIQNEDHLLRERTKEKNRTLALTPWYTLLLSLAAVMVVVIAYFRMRAEKNLRFRAQEKIIERTRELAFVNKQLTLKNNIFAQAEENALIGSYSWNLQSGKLEYSDNLFRLLGFEPGEFEPSFEKYLEFIHPDDREQVMKESQEGFEGRRLTDQIHRVISKDGKLKHFRSSRRIFGEREHVSIIGTIQDVSHDTMLNEMLRAQNLQLERSNAELESFNYIASHDLQEPLRKIQAFSYRILEKEKDHFSEATTDYFTRITRAASRMQNLIDALISYSKTNVADENMQSTNLNHLLDTVKESLADNIEEKNAVILYDNLPVVKIIPTQFQQLFINIISNAIKYSKKDIPPHITIHASMINGKEIEMADANKELNYWKISVEDNGIGFEQQYGHKIFELFQRLHSSADYLGTGIGLAICSKIMRNHHGFINATGNPGIGSIFNIYLPVKE